MPLGVQALVLAEHAKNSKAGNQRDKVSYIEQSPDKEPLPSSSIAPILHTIDHPKRQPNATFFSANPHTVLDNSHQIVLHSGLEQILSHEHDSSTSSATMSDPEIELEHCPHPGQGSDCEQQSLELPRIELPKLSGIDLPSTNRSSVKLQRSKASAGRDGTYRRRMRSIPSSESRSRHHVCDFPGCGKKFSYESKLRYVHLRNANSFRLARV